MLSSKVNTLLSKLFRVKIVRYRPPFDLARETIIRTYSVDLVIDGGANRGQWASEVRAKFNDLPVISIEPVNAAFQVLTRSTQSHKNWTALNVALGKESSTALMNVASNGEQSSSLLKPSSHLVHYPTVGFHDTQTTNVITLDSIDIPIESKIYLKLDLQGNELAALQGATATLEKVLAIEIEMTTIQMYEGQGTFLEVANFLANHGFSLFSFADSFRDPSGQSIYVDVIFARDNHVVSN
jgi:FkbM family methyltransferase